MIEIRTVDLEDAQKLVDIYRPYVEETAITFDYEVPNIHEFEEKISKTMQKYPFLVAVENKKILGYTYAGEFYPKRAYDWTAEITIYLDKQARGKGIGELLYNELEKQLIEKGICRLTSCISYPDEGSISFHEKHNFRKVAHFEKVGYKFNRWYDVVWYQKYIQEKEFIE
ncbi:GNAT family N-acetyltransferase [Gemella sp. ND 6198]|uniref:GNAT family N-acetyltransferase n=1 Tax=Gemella sp. ND 6198 TaxID=2040624 RepID=UPI000E0A8D32|nr:GNAT family N-acetyltransferase [Gemella sp. ND 6198]AXI26546.1 GNAT family N-acetyltransferase [Gemella sp. ND 6198]